jgi:hypothetical protein
MKKTLSAACCAAVISCAGSLLAAPIHVDNNTSTTSIPSIIANSGATAIAAGLAEDLKNVQFSLHKSEAHSLIDFLPLETRGTGRGAFNNEVTMALSSLTDPGTTTDHGVRSTVSFREFIVATGDLNWASKTFGLTSFNNDSTDDSPSRANSAGSAPIPEPTVLLMFGTGLIGLAGFARWKTARSA